MKRHIGNIWVSSETYEAIFEVFSKTRMKNISHTVDQMIKNYLTMGVQHERLIQEIGKLREELKQEKEKAESYRTQLLTGVKL